MYKQKKRMGFWVGLNLAQRAIFVIYMITVVGVTAGMIATAILATEGGSSITPSPTPSSVDPINPVPTTIWPKSVYIFDTSMEVSHINSIIAGVYATNGGSVPVAFNGQFTDKRVTFLFQPGTYIGAVIKIGYYTSVIGMGKDPSHVVIDGVVVVENGNSSSYTQGALDNFWRSCENITINNTTTDGTQLAVSQACPFRSVVVEGKTSFFHIKKHSRPGYCSGGFAANCNFKGAMDTGPQQQFCFRNSSFSSVENGLWNNVFISCIGRSLVTQCDFKNDHADPQNSTTVESKIIAEKPFLYSLSQTINNDFNFTLVVPAFSSTRSNGNQTDLYTQGSKIPKSSVFIAWDTMSAKTINTQLSAGKHIIFTPGIYNLEAELHVDKTNTVLYGMGMPTLIPINGNACIHTTDVAGVKISGLILQAGKTHSKELLQIGDTTSFGDSTNPTIIYDIFGRVGGPDKTLVSVDTMIVVNNKYVIGDDIWCWTADHGIDVDGAKNPFIGWDKNVCNHGIIINGDNVTMNGLAIEHTQNDLVKWGGDHGVCNFFQSELNYFAPSTALYGTVVAYHLLSNVTTHTCTGAGVYCFFEDTVVNVDTAFKIDGADTTSIHFVLPFTVYLGSKSGGSIKSILTSVHGAVGGLNPPAKQISAYVLSLPGPSCTWP
jgi:hypothetical protein